MLFTSLRVLTPPPVEPITLDFFRAHLRLDEDFDDQLLTAYLTAARENAEKYLGRALVTQTLQYTISKKSDILQTSDGWGSTFSNFGNPAWPWAATAYSEPIELPRSPVQAINSFLVLDHRGNITASQQTSAATVVNGSALYFNSIGCPAALGLFVQDLTASTIPIGTTVTGISTFNGITTVTLSNLVPLSVAQGDNILFSSIQSAARNTSAVTQALSYTGYSLYIADLFLEPARVRPDWSGVINALGTVVPPSQHLEIVFTVGYDGAGATVPQSVKQAILLTAAHFYERRGDEPGEMPEAIKWLLDNYRIQYL